MKQTLFNIKGFQEKVSPKFEVGPIDLILESGDLLWVCGPNGAGKSSLLRSLAHRYIEGPHSWCYLREEEKALFPLTVSEMVGLGGTDGIREAFDFTETFEIKDRDLRSLSSGEFQRVRLARALVRNPEVLVLDETLSRMDLGVQIRISERLKEWVSKKDRTLILVSHDFRVGSALSNRVLLMSQGQSLTPDLNGLKSAYPGVPEHWLQELVKGNR